MKRRDTKKTLQAVMCMITGCSEPPMGMGRGLCSRHYESNKGVEPPIIPLEDMLQRYTPQLEDLLRKCDSFYNTCRETLIKANQDYGRGNVPLFNFVKGSEILGLPAEQVLAVYLWKHIDSIFGYCEGRELKKEDIHSRIMDAVNYLFLLHALVKEKEK